MFDLFRLTQATNVQSSSASVDVNLQKSPRSPTKTKLQVHPSPHSTKTDAFHQDFCTYVEMLI